MLGIETVAILGAGGDGVGAAFVLARAGLRVRLADPRQAALDAAFGRLRALVDRAAAGGRLDPEGRQRVLDGVLITSEPEAAVVGADLVLAPDPATASATLESVVRACRATALLAAPIDPGTIAEAIPQPGRLLRVSFHDDGAGGAQPRLVAGPGSTAFARERAERLAARLRGGHSSR